MSSLFYMILGSLIVDISVSSADSFNMTWNYCNHPDCSLKNQHTLCLASNKQSPRLFASGMTGWMRYQLLLLHNRQRDNIALGMELGHPAATNMRKLYWDYELEASAEAWARQCQKRHDECRNTIRFNVLQNMDVRPIVPKVTEAQLLSDAVGSWFSGSRVLPPENVFSFRLGNCSAEGGCNAHWYSAVAWGSTWRMGCSQALCTAKKNSCSVYRRRRRISSVNNDTVTKNLLLHRTRLLKSHRGNRIEDYASSDKAENKESPLHRGILENARKEKPEEVNMIAFTFCNYGPAGNIDGFPMYEAGTPCGNCPPGTRCGDRHYRALCAHLRDPDLTE